MLPKRVCNFRSKESANSTLAWLTVSVKSFGKKGTYFCVKDLIESLGRLYRGIQLPILMEAPKRFEFPSSD